MRRAGGPAVEHQSEAIRQQSRNLEFYDLRQYRKMAHEGRQRDRVALDANSHSSVLDRTKLQRAINHQVIPSKLRARLCRKEETIDLRVGQLLVQRQ